MKKICVFASRYLKNAGSDDDTFVTFVGNKFFSFLGKILFSLELKDILYTYVMGKTNKFKELDLISNDFRLCVEFPIKMKISNSGEQNRKHGGASARFGRNYSRICLNMLKCFCIF